MVAYTNTPTNKKAESKAPKVEKTPVVAEETSVEEVKTDVSSKGSKKSKK